ncbi:hypothetical protein [Streptomyces sp. NBC_00827]|uniref:hypothetical protein n=1 Tax=Streptomyces sp. NBC_00827 TaxID=2903677 RepID=UPI00386BDEB8
MSDWAIARLPVNLVFGPDPPTHRRWVMARRSLTRPDELAYYLACAPEGAVVEELAGVAGSRWAIEACFQAAKNECGLDQYEVRRYPGRYRHITLAMLAHAFLAAMTAAEVERGAAETTQPTWPRSPWQRSGACRRLSAPGPRTIAPAPNWSHWRRRHRATARACRYRRRTRARGGLPEASADGPSAR